MPMEYLDSATLLAAGQRWNRTALEEQRATKLRMSGALLVRRRRGPLHALRQLGPRPAAPRGRRARRRRRRRLPLAGSAAARRARAGLERGRRRVKRRRGGRGHGGRLVGRRDRGRVCALSGAASHYDGGRARVHRRIDPSRVRSARRALSRRGPACGGAALGPPRQPGRRAPDRRRLLPRPRKLLCASGQAAARSRIPAADAPRLHAHRLAPRRRRVAHHRAADRFHARWRPRAQAVAR
mmetsp:Transcript_8805/g.30317  ORF Transcript_8805/g.30317 Transcript_8805/m.30317 type:complete len:240 (+) Transcript_8805:543-1262(+)